MQDLSDFLYSAKDSTSYLKKALEYLGRGGKTRMAKALRVQAAYLSQVLARKFYISLEQADLCNSFFKHRQEEADFFINLVSRDRAGTETLKRYYHQKIEGLLKIREDIVSRLGEADEVAEEAQSLYYSSWIYGAVCVATSIPGRHDRSSIAEYLNLPESKVASALDFLKSAGLIKETPKGFSPSNRWLRIGRDSPHMLKHNTHWRLKAIQNLDVFNEKDLHFSGFFGVDEKTAKFLKESLIKNIEESMKTIRSAKDEDIFVFNVDFFSLVKHR